MLLIHSFSLLATAALVASECTRESLTAARDGFFKAAGGTPKTAANVKISFNNKITPLAQTPFSKLSGFTQFIVQAVDTEICEIATFRVGTSQLLSTRLKLDTAGTISEIEFLQAVQGDQFFRPSGFPAKQPAMFNSPQSPGAPPKIPETWTEKGYPGIPEKDVSKATCKSPSGAARKLTRKELIFVSSTYADGLKGEPWASCVIGGSSCPRNENGVTTTQNCAVGTGMFGFAVKGRRWVADVETGVVLGNFYFDYTGLASLATQNLYLHEYFKVDAGKLAYIFAPMKNIPKAQAQANIF
ncbi:hypothetical protein E2P81_ATG01012 [Venturia nashicola]|uniref:DUF8021 domain-containing protein n=1 Tax=Venturia nashicola TaxID=86259 RepID=A0A4Z1PAV8_9PEZI|nr:hypothetical protein E6O75_ATG01035 [Venturia nashicola]TLD38469.1 hypothetical protein E2P81_ATG01012 [Venturia nashicola]